ncbi:MAG: GTP-binding protein gtr1 [Sclerophora amabilis]|nr:MAG: GTP-binding protein gtr1 [Sclerophora amabilis]
MNYEARVWGRYRLATIYEEEEIQLYSDEKNTDGSFYSFNTSGSVDSFQTAAEEKFPEYVPTGDSTTDDSSSDEDEASNADSPEYENDYSSEEIYDFFGNSNDPPRVVNDSSEGSGPSDEFGDLRPRRLHSPLDMEASINGNTNTSATTPGKSKKKKVLLMGKSGSGKSSMRSIVFSNYVARDTRRLGATIDVEHSHVRFLGNLTLNLWDCGGQDAFVENYLNTQRHHVFSNVGVLIYVFDIESREFDRDLITFSAIIRALTECSPSASVFCLIHKMDLVQDSFRAKLYDERVALVQDRSENFEVTAFATSIWDQSLYRAWARIIYTLIPNVLAIEEHLKKLAQSIQAEEIILFERTTFLVVTSVTNDWGARNPCQDRHERLSNVVKTFKQTLSRFSGLPRSAAQFKEQVLKLPKFTLIVDRFTTNTYILVLVPPGESLANGAVLNTKTAVKDFEKMDGLGKPGATAPAPAVRSADTVDSGEEEKSGTAVTDEATKEKSEPSDP